ncbi:MAG: hypothetical protein DYG89_42420 [Caldilinea sp. CFX5]|nr:hypothetical protein [Caldilinea sp. CFX5]
MVKRPSRTSTRKHTLVLTLYSILTLALTWPLLTHLTTHVPGVAQWAFDESTFLWNIWYFKHSLIDLHQSPLHSELIWYPLGIDLILYTYNFFHALVAQPLMLAVNLPFASNIALLLSTILSGYGTFLLVSYLLTQHATRNTHYAAFTAGALYAFASNRAIYATLGHYDMVTTQWIPFYALTLLRSLDKNLSSGQRRKAAVLAGIFFAFNGLAEMITALFLGIFTLIVLVIKLRTEPVTSQKLKAKIQNLSIVGLVAALLWGPVLAPILSQFLTNDFSLQGWGEAIPLSVDLLGWFTPTVLHPVFGSDLAAELRRVQERVQLNSGVGFQDINTVFLGWATLALALLGVIAYRRQVRIWLWTSLIFGIFTLGPFLQINGRYRFDLDGIEATFPLPFVILHYLPIIKANRAPNRNSVLLMLGLAVLVGYGVYWLLGYWQRSKIRTGVTLSPPHPVTLSLQFAVTILLTAAILFEHLALPAPLSDARIPAVYAQIAADPRPVSVLQVPLGWRNSFGTWGPEQTQLQYFQSAHGKPMLGGNISRAPAFKMDYFKRIPLFQAIHNVQKDDPVEPPLLEAAQAQAADLMYLYNTGYVLLYPPIPQRKPYEDNWQETWDLVKATLPLEAEPFWRGDGIEAYRVVQPPGSDDFTLDLGSAGTYPYRGEGWDERETDNQYDATIIWATAEESRLFVPLRQVDANATYTLQLRLHPYSYPGSQWQTVAAQVNTWQGKQHTLTEGWQEVSWSIPGSVLIDSLNHIDLHWGWTVRPRDVLGGSRQIGSTGVTLPVDAELNGFAEGGFIALFDEAGNQSDGSAGRNGVNVTVLDAAGEVLDKKGFDTTANSYESDALAEYLGKIEPGRIVLVTTKGDATAHLTEAAVNGLRALGAEVTIETLQGNYFSLIGVQGAMPGSAALIVDPNSAYLRIGLDPDRRSLAAAVDWVVIR